MRHNAFDVVRQFEQALCDYTGAKYAVATTSCTMALFLSLVCRDYRHGVPMVDVCIPSRTYVGVLASLIHAGYTVRFDDSIWRGGYELRPLNIWDYARRFTSGMYVPHQMQCVSFHWSKILAIGQGGAILHDDEEADDWLRRARFDGRTEGVLAVDDKPQHLGYHAYMMPRDAAEGLTRLMYLPDHNPDLPNDDYPDLSKMPIFGGSDD